MTPYCGWEICDSTVLKDIWVDLWSWSSCKELLVPNWIFSSSFRVLGILCLVRSGSSFKKTADTSNKNPITNMTVFDKWSCLCSPRNIPKMAPRRPIPEQNPTAIFLEEIHLWVENHDISHVDSIRTIRESWTV